MAAERQCFLLLCLHLGLRPSAMRVGPKLEMSSTGEERGPRVEMAAEEREQREKGEREGGQGVEGDGSFGNESAKGYGRSGRL
jgi:hypothetical protein